MLKLNRRAVLIEGTLTIFGGFTCACEAKDPYQGCSISINVAKSYAKDSLGIESNAIVANSGNREFDYAAAQTMSKLTDTFDVLPGFLYFKKDSKNAFATDGRLTRAPDGTILFGRDLLFEILGTSEAPDAVFSGICAHEYAHIWQFKNRLDMNRGQSNSKRGELHADFLAGYFAGVRKLENPDFPAAVIAVAHGTFGDYDFNHPQHHGTPVERSEAIVQGFKAAYNLKRSAAEAFEMGINYVKRQ